MAKRKMVYGISMLVMIAVLGMGCSTGNSGSDDEDTTDQTAGTGGGAGTGESPGTGGTAGTGGSTESGQPGEDTDITPLVGTWKAVDIDIQSSSTFTDTTTITIAADGTYTRLCVSVESFNDTSQDDDIVSYACKGSITRSGSTITTHITKEYETEDELNALPTTGWVNTTASETMPFYIRNGVLYNACFTRQGTGDSIIGTWVVVSQHCTTEDGSLQVEDDTVTHTIGATTIHSTDHEVYYPAENPTSTDVEDYSSDYTYVAKDADTITVTKTSTGKTNDWDYLLDGNTLVIVSDLGTELIKQ